MRHDVSSPTDLGTFRELFFVSAHFFSTWMCVYICVCLNDGRNICFTHAFVCEHDFNQVCSYLCRSDEGLCRRLKTYMLGIYSEMHWERPLCSWVLLSSENWGANNSGPCTLLPGQQVDYTFGVIWVAGVVQCVGPQQRTIASQVEMLPLWTQLKARMYLGFGPSCFAPWFFPNIFF